MDGSTNWERVQSYADVHLLSRGRNDLMLTAEFVCRSDAVSPYNPSLTPWSNPKMRSSGSWSPLSHGQEALWFLAKLVPQTWTYNVVLPVGIRGALDTVALRRALTALSDRHPSLRMEFREEGGAPRQRAISEHEIHFREIDASGWSDARMEDALRDEAHRPFDLEQSAVPRTVLFRRAPDHHVFVFVVHHIVSDLWSVIVAMDELRQLYSAERDGSPCDLPPLTTTYEQYVLQQREWLTSDAAEAIWSHWREELSADIPFLDLPTDHPRPSVQSFRGGSVTCWIDADLVRSLKQFAGRERTTPFMALLAVYQALLHRYTAQEQFVVGSPTSGRERSELQGIVGDFVNMVPFKADLGGNPSFRQLLAGVRSRVVGTIRHQEYPFSLLVDRLHASRDLSRSPVFQTTFVLQRFHRFAELSRVMLPGDGELSVPFADLALEPIPLPQQSGQFDVNLEMKEDDCGRLVGAWKYSADLFEPDTIARMASHFETLLRAIVADPDRPISELRLLADDERRKMIDGGRGRYVELPAAASVCELFEDEAARRSGGIAVSCGDDSVTYGALCERMTQLACALVRRGVSRDTIVPTLLPRGIGFVAALLAIGRAGGAFLPLDARHPISRTLQIVEGSGARFVLSTAALADELESAIAALPESARPRVVRIEELAAETAQSDLPVILGEDLAYVMYTSGSTGKPKGVMVEHRGMVNHVLGKLADLGMNHSDVLAQNGPPTFDIVVWQCLAPLIVGGRVVIFPDEVVEDAARMLAEVERCGVTVLQMVPALLHAVLEEATSRPEPPTLGSLRWMVPTGEALPTDLSRRWLDTYPDIPLLNTYGSTECSDDQCHYPMWAVDGADKAAAVVSIGTPIQNMAAYVLDAGLEPVPTGVVGELYIGGIGVGRGYVGDPERTATSFVPDPFSDRAGARLYRTRDLARRRPDGNLDFLGRTDEVIKLRGLRIEPGEIKAALRQHAAVADAAVLVREHPNGERMLVGFIVLAKGADTPALEELRRFAAQRLPQSMVPAIFMFIDALPLTPNGKLDHRRLPVLQWQGSTETEIVPPRTPTEERIAAIWAEVLGLEEVGVTQDFFSIGGDSIRSIQIVARCKRANLNVRPSDLFQHPTVAALAVLADTAQHAVTDGGSQALDVHPELVELAMSQVEFDED
jgi:amino acid adenylation domain-containing protein